MQPPTIYNFIGDDYDHTRKADPFIVKQLQNLLAAGKGPAYLDVGCGTGNYTNALFQNGLSIQGIDPSDTMLDEARTKNSLINWAKGTAENLPFAAHSFAGAIATLTIHHWPDLKRGFREIFRVLQPGGNFVVFTAFPDQMQNYWLNWYFPAMMQNAIRQMPTVAAISAAANEAGFESVIELKYLIADELQDMFLYAGKNKPSLYLNEIARKNISSFANLAHGEETELGLVELSEDILSGNFVQVKQRFDETEGDYVFIKLKKP